MQKYGLPKGVFDKKIYVKISKQDELTVKNIQNKTMPKMISQSLDLDFITDEKQYDPTERIKIRILTREDWGGVDWKSNSKFDVEPQHYEAVIFHAHGGGFILGSSGSS